MWRWRFQQYTNTYNADTDIKQLQSQIDGLKQESSNKDFIDKFDTIAFLTPEEPNYQVVKTNIGFLTFSLENVQAYANGSRVTVKIGNPTSATIDGLKSGVDWGSVNERGVPDNDHQRTKEVNWSESLRPGSWNSVTVTFFVLLKQRRRFVRRDIHSMQTGPVVGDSSDLQRLSVLSKVEGDRWQVTLTWWRAAGGAQGSLTKNQSG